MLIPWWAWLIIVGLTWWFIAGWIMWLAVAITVVAAVAIVWGFIKHASERSSASGVAGGVLEGLAYVFELFG